MSILNDVSRDGTDHEPCNTRFLRRLQISLSLINWCEVWAKTLGSFTAYMTTMIDKDLTLHRTLDELNAMMEERQLPADLRRSLRVYFRHVRQTETQTSRGLEPVVCTKTVLRSV